MLFLKRMFGARLNKALLRCLVEEGKIRILDPDDDFVAIPEPGTVPCGDLTQVEEEQIVEIHYLPRDFGVDERMFSVRAVGDSMEPEIGDGALLVVDPSEWENGDVMVAWVDGGVTCKYLQVQNGHVTLVPANPKSPPIAVVGSVRIFGRVEGYYDKRKRGNHR